MSTTEFSASAAPAAPRVVRRRRPLPGRRPIVGGLLVTVAVVGTFAAYDQADQRPSHVVLFARRPVAPGERLGADDVGEAPADLPDEVLVNSFDAVDEIRGSVTLAPLDAGDLVQRSAVLLADPANPSPDPVHEFSLPVERDRALNGALLAGELVDVLATYGTGEAAFTTVVTRQARVLDISETSSGLGSDGRIVATLALPSADEVLAAAHASEVGVVTLVRATRADGARGADRFAPASGR
jgi:Flp pilus assembly protein CpaB